MVRSSAGRVFHDTVPEKEKARSPNLVCRRGVVEQSVLEINWDQITKILKVESWESSHVVSVGV